MATLWLTSAPLDDVSRWLQASLGAVAVAGLVVARHLPLTGVLTAAGATSVAWFTGVTADPFALTGFAVFRLAESRGTRRFPWWMIAGAAITLVASLGLGSEGAESRFRTLLLSTVVLAAAWALGVRTREARVEAAARSRAEERLRLARDVHDVLSHSLGAIGVRAGVAAHISTLGETDLRETLRGIEDESRSSLADLKQLLDRERGWLDDPSPVSAAAALDSLVSTAERTGLDVRLDIDGDVEGLDASVKTTVLRLVQEAVTNVMRHASATSLSIAVRVSGGRAEVDVHDDGGTASDGFRPGHGLTGMRERVELLGGTISARSSGSGFTVSARIPLNGGTPVASAP